MYKIDFKPSVKKDFKNINISDIQFIYNSLKDFIKNFNSEYEINLMKKGAIKKLKGQKEELYRLKLRSFRIIYKKYEDRLVILVVHVTTREGAYK